MIRARALPWREPAFLAGLLCYAGFTYWAAHGTLYIQGLVLVAAVFGMLAVSLDMVAGMAGLYSLGHAGLFALGAYATALLYNDRHWNLFVILPVCVAGVGVVGLLLGAISLRVSGLYFAITTFVFTLVLTVFASDLKFTGGYGGVIGPIFPEFPHWLAWAGQSLIWCCLIGLLLTLLVTLAIRRSPLYPLLLAIRDAEPFAAAAGANVSAVKVGLFGLSAAIAGAAGWIFAFQGIVSPSQFNWAVSVNILVMVILGGMNTTIGPVLGAAFITIFPAQVNINPFWQEVLFGGLFVGVIVLFPAGFMGLVHLLVRLVDRRKPALARRVTAAAAPIDQSAVEAAAVAGAEHPENVPAAIAGADDDGDAREPAISCRGIVFRYPDGPAVLHDVDFTVRKGTIHGLIGPNGSGKSTLVDLISGRLRPQAGSIAIDGARVERYGAATRAQHGVARTFQSAVLVQELPARQNVTVGLYTRIPHLALRAPFWPALPSARRESRRVRSAVLDALEFVGARQWADARVADIPHGIEQLTQLAAACASGPSTLILDEPLAGLSPSEVEHAATILAELKSAGVSIVLIEHQPRFVFALSDEVTVLAAGAVVATGPAAAVRANEQVREVYLGQ
ncbi:MAG TPA: ATP-binding cassette domain-containing protein [Gaiellaceae bacterium]|jgi:branched-chain amino acid transport system permease protein|nr:ATP-binding cassette domain-containing protein [Gaiellaceae bacterium]